MMPKKLSPQKVKGKVQAHASPSVAATKAIKSTGQVIPFNPLDKRVLGAGIAEVLLTTPAYSLAEDFPYRGAGIYALYYRGTHAVYAKLAAQNLHSVVWPIYVGQALPSGGRRGLAVVEDDWKLRQRVRDHRKSIDGTDLQVRDFCFRALVMDDAFIRLGETSLIAIYRPVWNSWLDGFGNHAPGGVRASSKRSRWDTLHGGRTHAIEHSDRDETRDHIVQEITGDLNSRDFYLPQTLLSAPGQSQNIGVTQKLEAAVETPDVTSGGTAGV